MELSLELGQQILATQPFSRHVGARLTHLAPGAAEIRLPLREELCQQHGFAHGGVVAYLADNTLTYAGGSMMGSACLTAEFKISYLRPAVGEELVARAQTVYVGRRQATCRCDVFALRDGKEVLCATALGTIARMDEPNRKEQ
ncbi:MAG: PaaI family thioesterase [Pseudomonadota bacterium]